MKDENANLRERLRDLPHRDFQPSWNYHEEVENRLDLDSICCFVTPTSLDALCGPVLELANTNFRHRDDVVGMKLCQVTTDPMIFIEEDEKILLIRALRTRFQVLVPH